MMFDDGDHHHDHDHAHRLFSRMRHIQMSSNGSQSAQVNNRRQTTHRLQIHGYRFRYMASGVEEVQALIDRLQKKWMTKARWTDHQWRSAVRKITKLATWGGRRERWQWEVGSWEVAVKHQQCLGAARADGRTDFGFRCRQAKIALAYKRDQEMHEM